MIMGINGVGKSTLVRHVADALPDATAIYASQELRKIFGGATRAELEAMEPEEKLIKKATHLAMIFQRIREERGLAIVDMHLVVPIRSGETLRYENTWSDVYQPYLSGSYMLVAPPPEILARRKADALTTGRERDLSEQNIAQDQNINVQEFLSLVDCGALPKTSQVVENRDELSAVACERILSAVLAL